MSTGSVRSCPPGGAGALTSVTVVSRFRDHGGLDMLIRRMPRDHGIRRCLRGARPRAPTRLPCPLHWHRLRSSLVPRSSVQAAPRPPARAMPSSSDVEEPDVFGVPLDERTPCLYVLAHQHGEQLVGLGRVI